ncbi:MAG: amidohydrolase, partial [Planctomycetaceae bacterium]
MVTLRVTVCWLGMLWYVPVVSAAEPADLLLHSGRIYTADVDDSVAAAMAIREGRIVAVGTNEDILKLADDRTKQIDLEGRFVAPGLIDSHVHAGGAAMFEFDHDVPDMETIPDVLDYVRQRATVVPEGDWIVLQQVFITRLKEQRYPTKAELDEAAPKHPVVFRTGPDAAVNSLALERCGIDRDFAAQHSENVQVDRATGEPTDVLRQSGSVLKGVSASSSRKATEQDRVDCLAALLADYNSVGITGAIDRNCSDGAQGDYERLEREGRLTVRMRLSRGFSATRSIEEVKKDLDTIAADPLFTTGSDRLKIIGVKVFLDGGMLTGSAYMSQPWGVSRIYSIDDPAYRGMRYISAEQLIPAVKACAERNLAFTAHSVGDAAVSGLLDAYAAVNQEIPISPTHSTITHSNFMSAKSIRRCAELGVGVDIQPAWLYLDSHTLAAQFGEDRLRYFQPLSSLFAAHVSVGGGSDHMQKLGSLRSITPYDPFLGMWTAITRSSKYYDHPLHPEEALTRTQALRFYTINNAWLMRAEDRLGSLEPGKLADFIILDRDLLECKV